MTSPSPSPTPIDAERDPVTAAAICCLVGMLAALERGEAIATACHAVDDEGEWSLTLKLAEVAAPTSSTTTTMMTTTPCPLCKQPGFAGQCRHCDYGAD